MSGNCVVRMGVMSARAMQVSPAAGVSSTLSLGRRLPCSQPFGHTSPQPPANHKSPHGTLLKHSPLTGEWPRLSWSMRPRHRWGGSAGFRDTRASSRGIRGAAGEMGGEPGNIEQPPQSAATSKMVYSWPFEGRPRICILGGGFGGLYTALRLESLIWPADKRPQVVLVDQSDRFVFKPLLYELLTKEVDEWEIAPRFTDLLAGTDVQFVRDSVRSVHPGQGAPPAGTRQVADAEAAVPWVVLGSGMELSYDWLVLSLGAAVAKGGVPGAQEHAQAFATLEDALATDAKLQQLERRRVQQRGAPIRVAVVGGGYSGVELASTVAQRLGERGRVQIIDPSADIIASAPPGNREAARKVLTSRGVEFLLSSRVVSLGSPPEASDSAAHSAPPAPTAAVLELATTEAAPAGTPPSRTVEADLVLWTVGNRPMVPPNGSGVRPSFPTTGRGQADTESTLRVKGYENAFALGDAAAFTDASGKLLAGTAQVAFQQADYAAWNLWASINQRPLLPFRYQHLGEMMTLGSNEAAVSLGFIEGVTLEGPIAHAARKLAYLYRQPTTEHMAKVGLSWLAKSAVDTVALAQDSLIRALGSR